MQTIINELYREHTETEYISRLFSIADQRGFSLALWRLPHSNTKHLIISQQVRNIDRQTPIEELTAGFIFAPFDPAKESIFLPDDYHFSFSDNKFNLPQTPQENRSFDWMMEQSDLIKTSSPAFKRISPSTPLIEKIDFIHLVNKSLEAINQGQFEKVVPSRIKEIRLPETFSLTKTFQNLCMDHPNALVSFVHIPETGSWMGASPEILVSVENGSTFRTVALAGTQPFHEGINLKTVAWTQKEIEEQALVERYIISCFKKIRLREYEEHGPKTVIAGNLMHLKSDFFVDMKAANFPQLGSIMLQLLHPTSAVCGMPLESSLDFLKKNEGYDREFYSGYLGPVNFQNNSHLYVNLRCMKFQDNRAILYAGAGVTSDSDPESEWNETEIKFNTLLTSIL